MFKIPGRPAEGGLMVLLLILTVVVVGITMRTASTPGWASLSQCALTSASRVVPAQLTNTERANMRARAHELKADVDWCLSRARRAARKAARDPQGRTRLLKEADVYERAARELADDALALLDASRGR